MIFGYDYDGVMCEPPYIPGNKFRTLTLEERLTRYEELVHHFRTAAPIIDLSSTTHPFIVISARPDTPEFRAASEEWLEKHHPGRWTLYMDRSTKEVRDQEHVIQYKAGVINKCGITHYTEDNPHVCSGLAKLCPNTKVTVYEPI